MRLTWRSRCLSLGGKKARSRRKRIAIVQILSYNGAGWGWDMIYIGIDPGKHGGIAVIRPGEVLARPIPETDRELLAFLAPYRPVVSGVPSRFNPIAFAVLE